MGQFYGALSVLVPVLLLIVSRSGRCGHATIFTIVTGQNPTYGYHDAGPVLDIAFDIVRAKYPTIFANVTVIRQYNAAPVSGCVETGDIMHAMAAEMFRLMEEAIGLPIILSPGKK